jgi:tetratricopeptide (TPR) repeat protein
MRKITYLGFSIMIMLIGLFSAPLFSITHQEKLQQYLDTAMQTKNPKEAFQLYSVLIEKSPTFAAVYLQRGLLLYDNQAYREALPDLKKSLELNPQLSRAAIYQIACMQRLSEYDSENFSALIDGISVYEKNDSQNLKFYRSWGNLYFDQGNYPKAIEKMDQALKIDPQNTGAYMRKVEALIQLKNEEAAIALLNQSTRFEKAQIKNDDFFYARAIMYSKLKNTQRSIQDYDRAIAINPQHAQALNNRALLKEDLGDYEGAFVDLTRSINISPFPANLCNRGTIHFKNQKFDLALKDFNDGLKNYPDYPSCQKMRIRLLHTMKDFERALNDANAYLEKNPNDWEALYYRAGTYVSLKEHERALNDYNRFLEHNPQSPQVNYDRGMLRLYMTNRAEGCDDLKKAAELGFTRADQDSKLYCQ